ncbi:MAG: hypothetical protein ABSD57_05650 [Verrucomicrobiota bacterium]
MKDKNFNAKAQRRKGRAGSPLPAAGPQTKVGAHGVTRPTQTTA